jgi:hypothetical protein
MGDLREMGVKFAPDLVLVAYVLNDADYAGNLDVWEGFRQQYEKSWCRFSHVLSFAYARLGQHFFVRKYVAEMTAGSLREEGKWLRSFKELERGREIARSVGAAFAVAILPFMYDLKEDNPFLPIHRLIQEYCIHHDIPVTDLFPVFKGQKYADLWVHESDPHPNEKGHELIARGLFDFIISKQLL